jgi:HTH-type transcriptional regulator/antitoxin HipB
MITSTRQYGITRTRAIEVRNALADLQRAPVADTLQPEMRELQLAALRGTLHDLEAELADYDRATRTERI